MKQLILTALVCCGSIYGAIGDNAPSVPSTYVTTHPRLPNPDTTFLAKICNNGGSGGTTNAGDGCSMTPSYRTAAEGWNYTAPGSRINMRRLLIAYLATKNNGTPNASYLTKIQEFTYSSGACNLLGAWNLTTGNGYWDPAIALSLSYDWIYADLGANSQSCSRSFLYTMMSGFETNYSNSSAYNDQFYLTGFKQILHLLAATAIYPDDATNSLPHLRFSMDMFLNQMLPIWKQVMGGAYCGSSNDSSNDCGGGWHEPWNDYQGKTESMTQWFNTYNLVWATASGRGISNWFTVDNPWLKNFAYWTLYETRPDFNLEPIGDESRPYLVAEYSAGSSGADLGYIEGSAAIYNDATLRGWARTIDWAGAVPNGFEPSAWPYYTPDSSTNTANARSASAPIKNFPGWGTVFFRTGWGESDTFCTLRHGDNFWSHPIMDTGAFTCFNRGPLAIRSGTYRSGSACPHYTYYAGQAIAQNVPLVYDSGDVYAAETVGACGPTNNSCSGGSNPDYVDPMPNDGGQRRVGSAYGNYTGNVSASAIGGLQAAPADIAQWYRGREYYHLGRLVAYATGASNKYGFAAVDMTAAYNNLWSRNSYSSSCTWCFNTANTSNRSLRVQKAVRQFLFIPRGTAAYVVVYDQITSTNTGFTKKDLIHSVNQPTISGNSYTIARTETVTSKPFANYWPQAWGANIANCPTSCSSATQYNYNGKLYGWLTYPSTGALSTVGGAGHEFQITDSNGTNNWNQCMYTQCSYGSIAGSVAGTYNITAGSNDTLLIAVDGGSNQTITLTAGASRTAAQVVADINAVLTGATASVEGNGGGYVAIKSNSVTAGSASIKFSTVTNSAYATLGFTVGTYTGDNYDEGLGAIGDYMHPVNTTAPAQPGAWRIEETTGTTQLADQLINVMLVTSASDTNTVSTAPTTSTSGSNYVTTWKDNTNTCTYTVTQPINGIGATLTAIGAGCTTVIN